MKIINLYHIYSMEMYYNFSTGKLIKGADAGAFKSRWQKGVDVGFLHFQEGVKIEGMTAYGPMREVL